MSDCVVLSDSDESVSPIETDKAKRVSGEKRSKHYLDDSDLNDFEFPPVNFYYTAVDDDQEEQNLPKNTVNNASINLMSNLYNRAWTNSTILSLAKSSEDARKQRDGREGVKSVAKKAKSRVIEDRWEKTETINERKSIEGNRVKEAEKCEARQVYQIYDSSFRHRYPEV